MAVIEPIFEVQFRSTSYGFRPARGCKDGLREVDQNLKEGFTHVTDSQQPGQGFDFPGYRFQPGKRRVRKKSMRRFKENIREKTRRTRGISVQQMVDELNLMLRGGSLTISDMRVDIFSVL